NWPTSAEVFFRLKFSQFPVAARGPDPRATHRKRRSFDGSPAGPRVTPVGSAGGVASSSRTGGSFAPLPLEGRGWGRGSLRLAEGLTFTNRSTPTPALPSRGRERRSMPP